MKKLLTIAALTASTFTAQADVRINGFANFIGGITSSDDTLYGYDDKIGFSEESSFAIQVAGDINDKMTATGQIVARGENDYEAKFEWAYITYQATDNLSISAGRLRMPLFKYSTSLDVGYSYHWVNAPSVIYDVPYNNIDGIKIDYSNYSGDWEYNTRLTLGKLTTSIAASETSIVSDNLVVLSVDAVNNWFKVGAVYGVSKSTAKNQNIDTALSVLDNLGLTQLSNDLDYNNDTTYFTGFNIEVDTYDWFVSGEITIIDAEKSLSPKSTAYYVTAGLRLDKFTPSVTYESFDSDESPKFLDQVEALPFPAEAKAGIEALVRGIQITDKYSVISLGLRYDLDTNVALKTDISRYDNDLDETESTLLRFAVNYVF